MRSFEQLERTVTRTTRVIALIGLAGLLALASATVLDVLLRWIFNSPIVGLNDTHSLFTALIIASCFPLCIYRRGNITIRFIGDLFGPRVRNLLDAFGNLVTLILFLLMAWQFWLYTDQLIEDGETTWVLNWPVSPWWRAVTILIIICVPVTLVTVIQYLRSALRNHETSDAVESSADQPEEGKP
jgi:TRAP-type C4-dicarboxylate transport system permease small subunit